MKKFLSLIGLLALLVAFTGCHTPQLESGGAYNPDPATLAPQQALYLADAGYKLAYDAVDGAFLFERNHRAELLAITPKIKAGLDAARPQALAVEKRWAIARATYKANPTPANLTAIQQALAEIQRLIPVVQGQLTITK